MFTVFYVSETAECFTGRGVSLQEAKANAKLICERLRKMFPDYQIEVGDQIHTGDQRIINQINEAMIQNWQGWVAGAVSESAPVVPSEETEIEQERKKNRELKKQKADLEKRIADADAEIERQIK